MLMIVNGKSASNPALRNAVSRIRDDGYSLDVRVTWEAGDAARYALEAFDGGYDVAVAAGGDGTVNEVTQGLLSTSDPTSTAVAIVPFGTANDFATGCHIPLGNPLAALRLAATGTPIAIDVGQANDDYFINVASGGFGAEVTVNTPPELKRMLGGAAYSLMGIISAAKMTPQHCRVTLHDGTVHEGDMLVLAVGNARQCGGGQQVTPRALLNDGLLDLMIVHDVDLSSFGTLLNELLNLGEESNRYASYAQVPSFRIESNTPLQINLDGEPVRSSCFDFRILPGAVRFILGEGAPVR
jgi:lipid kinase YegS